MRDRDAERPRRLDDAEGEMVSGAEHGVGPPGRGEEADRSFERAAVVGAVRSRRRHR